MLPVRDGRLAPLTRAGHHAGHGQGAATAPSSPGVTEHAHRPAGTADAPARRSHISEFGSGRGPELVTSSRDDARGYRVSGDSESLSH
jgi:hypothetical protein